MNSRRAGSIHETKADGVLHLPAKFRVRIRVHFLRVRVSPTTNLQISRSGLKLTPNSARSPPATGRPPGRLRPTSGTRKDTDSCWRGQRGSDRSACSVASRWLRRFAHRSRSPEPLLQESPGRRQGVWSAMRRTPETLQQKRQQRQPSNPIASSPPGAAMFLEGAAPFLLR